MRTKKYLTFSIGSRQVRQVPFRKAVTIPELFIVLLLIAIVGAISAPKFSEAKAGGDLTRLVRGLETVRQQIELYQAQHNGLFPGQSYKDEEIGEEDFVSALTESNGVYGPYLKKIPKNPFNGLRTVRVGSLSLGSAAGAGWFFNYKTGDFRADDLKYHRAY